MVINQEESNKIFEELNRIPEEVKQKLVSCVQKSHVETEDNYNQNNIKNPNGKGFTIWDFINKNCVLNLNIQDIISAYTKRSSWNMTPIYYSPTNTIITFMREQRYKEIIRGPLEKAKKHYLSAFAGICNKDIPHNDQMTFFTGFQNDNEYMLSVVENILKQMELPYTMIQRHLLILFDSIGYTLTSIRCCVLDSNLVIVDSQDLSKYISVNQEDEAENIPIDTDDLPLAGNSLSLKENIPKTEVQHPTTKQNKKLKEESK